MTAERDLIVHIATGRVLDMAIEADRDFIRDLRGECSFSRPVLVCKAKGNPLYLQEREGKCGRRLWAIHQSSECCPPRLIPGGMSDLHKWQTEYLVRGFEAAGYPVASEVLGRRACLDTGVIPDAIAYGRVTIGAEVQRSGLAAASAVSRTRKALAAGVSDIWFTDWKRLPKWTLRVPTVGMNCQSWNAASKGSATVTTGVRVITAARCEVGNFRRCPVTRRNWCGKYHAKHEPWLGLRVDDIADLAPAGEIMPIKFAGRATDVILISKSSLAMYEDLIGRRVEPVFRPAVIPLPRVTEVTGPVLCPGPPTFRGEQLELGYPVRQVVTLARPAVSRRAPGTCAGGCGARPLGGAAYCQACRLLVQLRGGRPGPQKDVDELAAAAGDELAQSGNWRRKVTR